MVFFFVACHRQDDSEENSANIAINTVTGGLKPLGDMYNFVVRRYIISLN